MADPENTRPFYNCAIPRDWEIRTFGSLFNLKNGINAAKESYGSGVKFINVMEVIYNNFITTESIPGSVIVSDERIKSYLVKRGNVLFNRTSETIEEIGLASVYLDDERVIFGGFVIRGIPKDESIDNDYKKYCFRSAPVRRQIVRLGQGAIRSNIGQADLETVELSFPSVPEQKAIAHVLGLMDGAIDQVNQLIAKKELRKKWLMQNLLTGKKRLKGFNVEWKEFPLGEIFAERNETNYVSLPLLSVGASGIYPQANSIKRDISKEDKSKYKRICPGDIGYNTMRMWQGRSALSSLEGIVSPAYTIVVPKETADSLFFSYLFKTPKLMNLFWRNSQGLVDDTLNCKFKDFSIVKVHLPKKDEQTAIARVLQAADKEIQLLKTKTENLREQKKGMMQQLLTGKKRLKIGD